MVGSTCWLSLTNKQSNAANDIMWYHVYQFDVQCTCCTVEYLLQMCMIAQFIGWRSYEI